MPLKTYFDFAENDYQFFVESCERNAVANIMGAIAQNICEKYMKHLIDTYEVPANEGEEEEKTKILKSHNFRQLLGYIRENLGVEFSYDTAKKMRDINGYYISARYPGDIVVNELTKSAIDKCLDTVQNCRKETLELMAKLEKKPSLTETLDAAEKKAGTSEPTKVKEPER